MPINTSFLRTWIFLAALLGANTAFAQVDSALGGKIVHVYLPSDEIDTLVLRNWSLPTKKTGRYWYTVTLQGDKYNSNQGFFFANPQSNRFIMKTGFLAQEVQTARFMVADFQGKNEMWIIFDPSGPMTATPFILLEPPKIVNILNPWETTGPRLRFAGGTNKNMVTNLDHCGWFMAFLLRPTEMSLHFQELNGTETYGAGGQGTVTNFDMTAEFTAKGVRDTLGINLWLDTDINSWLPTYPNKDGNCQYQMAATVRDFSRNHPDFDHPAATYVVVPGMVQPTIGADRKPVRTTKTAPWTIFNDFNSWWNTDSANATPANRSYETCVDIPMSKSSDGLWEYDSYPTPARGFYPIDNFNRHNETAATCSMSPSGQWSNQTALHNLNYCLESHATFIYQRGQKFEFRGDDDVWVYINDKLVIDLGGLHIPVSDTVDLDTLGLTVGSTYKWDFFYCERQPCGSSLRIKTSIFFKQQKALEAVPDPARPGTFTILKREGGKGSCAGQGDTLKQVPATNLTYQLWDATGAVVAPLGNGSFYNGSLVIRTASAGPPPVDAEVKVDTNIVVTTLAPGNYRVVAFDPANSKVRAEVPYKVVARNQVMVHAPVGDTSVPLGTLVRVVMANKFNNAVVAAVQSYAPSYPPTLLVYLDAARTQLATPTSFTTDATGYDTLWVTDTTMAATDRIDPVTVPGTTPILRITFVVPKNKVELEPPASAGSHLLGTLVRVLAANREAGTLVPKVGSYTLIIPAGLDVFSDSLGRNRIPAGTVLTTDISGFDSLWVTSTVAKDTAYVLGITGSGRTVTVTFLTPKDRMQFDHPLVRDTLVGSLVRLTASNRENGVLKPKAQEYTLNIPAGLKVYADEAKTIEVLNGTRLTSAPDGLDTLWATADSVATDYEDKTFILEIVAGLNPMSLTFRMPALVLPRPLTAAMFDDDLDGIPDRLAVTYDRDIAGNLPKLAEYRWPAATTPPQAITDLAGKVSGATLTHRGPMTTVPATAGNGIYVSTYQARKRGDSSHAIAIHDRMGPILTKAEIVLGATSDTLHLKFSEPVNVDGITAAEADLFGYKILPDGEPVAFDPADIAWDADRQGVSLVFPNPSTKAPKSGNLVRINDGQGFIADANGNTAGKESRFRVITGIKRTEIQTVTYRQIEPTPALLREEPIAPSLQPLGSEVKVVVEATGRMGHLIKTDLGDYAVGDDFTPVQPSQVTIEYQASYYTNHGTPVISAQRTLACTDAVFRGDCLKNRGFLFVGWNYTADDGSKIGTGAIVSRFRYQVKVAGKMRENVGLDQVWGVLRR